MVWFWRYLPSLDLQPVPRISISLRGASRQLATAVQVSRLFIFFLRITIWKEKDWSLQRLDGLRVVIALVGRVPWFQYSRMPLTV